MPGSYSKSVRITIVAYRKKRFPYRALKTKMKTKPLHYRNNFDQKTFGCIQSKYDVMLSASKSLIEYKDDDFDVTNLFMRSRTYKD